MTNMDLELEKLGQIALTDDEKEAIKKVIVLARRHQDHVLWRVKLKVAWVFRPSYAVRLKLFLPWLAWLLDRVTDMPTLEQEETPNE